MLGGAVELSVDLKPENVEEKKVDTKNESGRSKKEAEKSTIIVSGRMMNQKARAQLGKETINVLIPQILTSNDRARAGVGNSKLIRYDPSLAPKVSHSLPAAAGKPPVTVPKIKVIQSDSFDAAQAILKSFQSSKHSRLAVLNMCSIFRPGGGVLNGDLAQEESLCIRSTLYSSLHDNFYRLPEDGAIYSPDVLVFRTSDYVDLPKKDRFFVDVISCPALKSPHVVVSKGDGIKVYETESSREAMTLKVRVIMQVAIQNGVSHLVLGALGCGAYKNPPAEVARIFKRVICGDRKSPGMTAGLEEIHFAIFDNGENLRTFRDVFQDVVVVDESWGRKLRCTADTFHCDLAFQCLPSSLCPARLSACNG